MKTRILIADDASFMRQMIREILEPEGFEIAAEAADGLEAVAQYQAVQPDLVTMDIVMPKRSGIDAVRDILELDPQAQIVMCSALGQETLVTEALEAGAVDHVVLIYPIGNYQIHLEAHVTRQSSGLRFAEQAALDAPGDIIDNLSYGGQSLGFTALLQL